MFCQTSPRRTTAHDVSLDDKLLEGRASWAPQETSACCGGADPLTSGGGRSLRCSRQHAGRGITSPSASEPARAWTLVDTSYGSTTPTRGCAVLRLCRGGRCSRLREGELDAAGYRTAPADAAMREMRRREASTDARCGLHRAERHAGADRLRGRAPDAAAALTQPARLWSGDRRRRGGGALGLGVRARRVRRGAHRRSPRSREASAGRAAARRRRSGRGAAARQEEKTSMARARMPRRPTAAVRSEVATRGAAASDDRWVQYTSEGATRRGRRVRAPSLTRTPPPASTAGGGGTSVRCRDEARPSPTERAEGRITPRASGARSHARQDRPRAPGPPPER